jgi:hypothetical protein
MTEKARLTLDLDAKMHKRLKMLAASKGITMRELCVSAIRLELARDKAIGPDPVLEELWDNQDDAVFDDL